ncbi:PLP-dependent transferase [Rhizobium leguminosarum]|uniref:PLP-dependent transferase n=1 Tax=Rhizobium leguminosarum TaxID=384 RepID=UPI001D3A9C8D|nr:PLP-dependent transferase [Rhizobium leguminosarum]MBP2449881.1 cystathionine beta-lyase/cystathionine gamma-synthase [Rhizobium leguminosarum]
MLEAHQAVAWVSYPFLDSHPGKAIAQKQMSNGSGMLAFGLKSGFDGARKIFDRFQLLTRAVSLGDTDSLIYHPASIMRARQAIRKDAHLVDGVGEDLIRLSVGLETVDDIVADLQQALAAV